MKTIWKWKLSPETLIEMPQGAQILTIQLQHDAPCLWALVDPKAPLCWRTFRIYGTGHNIVADPGKYVGTFQMQDGALVFHVFEIIEHK